MPCYPHNISTMLSLGTAMPRFTHADGAHRVGPRQPGKQMVEYCKMHLFFDPSAYLDVFTSSIQSCNGTKIKRAYNSIIGDFLPFYLAWAYLLNSEQCSEAELKAKLRHAYAGGHLWHAEYSLDVANERLDHGTMQTLGSLYEKQDWKQECELSDIGMQSLKATLHK